MRKCCKFIKTFAFFSYSLQKDLIEIFFFLEFTNFFQLIKLRDHFKDETCIKTVNQPNE